jgi:hypothetical protein
VRTPKVRRRTDSSFGELPQNETAALIDFAQSAFGVRRYFAAFNGANLQILI